MQIKQTLISLVTVAAISVTSVSATAADTSWTDSIKVDGDFRYRFELIDQENSEKRERSRLRARINLKAEVNETVKVGVRLASGSDDPVSTNQSLDKFASTKDFGLDRAFVTWAPAKGHAITAGKMGVPFYKPNKSGLIWDGDLNPEGLSYTYKANGFWGTLARFNLDECSSCDDSYLNGAQAGYGWKLANGSKINAGLGFYSYDLNAVETGLPDVFSMTELLADYQTKVSGRPLTVYANYVKNSDVDDLDTGYEAGFKYGKAKPGQWEFGYAYKKLEAGATFPLFTDSDFAGGGTDGDGHILKVGYGVSDNFTIGLTQFINTRGISDAATELDYNRTQFDFKFKF